MFPYEWKIIEWKGKLKKNQTNLAIILLTRLPHTLLSGAQTLTWATVWSFRLPWTSKCGFERPHLKSRVRLINVLWRPSHWHRHNTQYSIHVHILKSMLTSPALHSIVLMNIQKMIILQNNLVFISVLTTIVRIPAATDVSHKNWKWQLHCKTLSNRCECHGWSKMTNINGCSLSQ